MSNVVTKTEASLAMTWQLCLFVLAGAAAIMLPDLALAAYGNGIEEVLCKAKDLFTGPTGKALATIAVTIIGIGALLGKVSWGMAMIVGIGIALVFGAASLVDVVAPGGPVASC